ncbi:MAG: hypothetical protein NC092_09040, partial [Butyrivibrio sp.]|nr:hypothetical protein [Butyrivibrio sp.]
TFSLQDIQFFVQHPMIEVMTIVSNQGTVHYMKRDKNYDYAKTFELFSACVGRIDGKASSVEMYMASLEFLAKCSEAGLYYR